MHKSLLIFVSILFNLFAFSFNAKADYLNISTGSYQGFLSVGYGHRWLAYDDWGITQDAKIGVVPAVFNGRDLWMVSSRLQVHLKDIFFDDTEMGIQDELYFGFGVIVDLSKHTYFRLPDKYPKDYYPPTAFLYSPAIGYSLSQGKHAYFAEVSTLEFLIEYLTLNSGYLSVFDILSFGIGYQYEFDF